MWAICFDSSLDRLSAHARLAFPMNEGTLSWANLVWQAPSDQMKCSHMKVGSIYEVLFMSWILVILFSDLIDLQSVRKACKDARVTQAYKDLHYDQHFHWLTNLISSEERAHMKSLILSSYDLWTLLLNLLILPYDLATYCAELICSIFSLSLCTYKTLPSRSHLIA